MDDDAADDDDNNHDDAADDDDNNHDDNDDDDDDVDDNVDDKHQHTQGLRSSGLYWGLTMNATPRGCSANCVSCASCPSLV